MDNCVICCNEINNTINTTLDCMHKFHTNCVMKWIIHKNNCPICRNTIVKEKIKKEPEYIFVIHNTNSLKDIMIKLIIQIINILVIFLKSRRN